MIKNTFIYGHKFNSEGMKAIAEGLGIRRIRSENSRFTPNPNRTVINWGASELPPAYNVCKIINKPEAVAKATNKGVTFENLDSCTVRTVPWTRSTEKVKEWLSDGHTVCARKKLNASGGDGLVIFDGGSKFETAPLWTQYVKKRDEYRIHVFGGCVFSIQRKALKKVEEGEETKPVDHRIRNLANGYIFARNDVNPPDDVYKQAVACVQCLGLDFGAVDVIFNERRGLAYVLEVNTAPGIEGTTLLDYISAFNEHFGVA